MRLAPNPAYLGRNNANGHDDEPDPGPPRVRRPRPQHPDHGHPDRRDEANNSCRCHAQHPHRLRAIPANAHPPGPAHAATVEKPRVATHVHAAESPAAADLARGPSPGRSAPQSSNSGPRDCVIATYTRFFFARASLPLVFSAVALSTWGEAQDSHRGATNGIHCRERTRAVGFLASASLVLGSEAAQILGARGTHGPSPPTSCNDGASLFSHPRRGGRDLVRGRT